MYPEELKKRISGGDVSPLYFFYGENTHLIEETIKQIISTLFPSGPPDLDLNYYDAQTHTPSEIVQSVRTVPFLSPRRMVVVRRGNAFKEAQWKTFQGCFSKPSSHCCLVLTGGEKLAIKGTLLSSFKKSGIPVLFRNPKREKDIRQTVKAGLQKYGKSMTPAAETCFVDTIGGDAQLIANELEKLALYCAEKKKIDVEDLEDIISSGHTTTIFKLVDGIGHGNVEKSLRSLEALLGEGVYPLVILKMVARQIRLLSRAKEGLMKGESPSRVVQELNMKNDYAARGVVEQARGWPVQGLGGAFEEIFQSNCMIKSSRIDSKIILESLVFKLAGFRNQPFA